MFTGDKYRADCILQIPGLGYVQNTLLQFKSKKSENMWFLGSKPVFLDVIPEKLFFIMFLYRAVTL